MARDFAKLYETERGQVLAMVEKGDDGYQISIHFDAGVEELAVSSISLKGFQEVDGDEGCKFAYAALDAFTEEKTKAAAFSAMDQIAAMFARAE